MNADVVIAGAGPTGLMLAAELRLAGADVLVLDRLPGPTGQSRALGLNPRALELFDQRGILDRFADLRVITGAHYGALPQPLDFGRLDSPHGAMLVPQSRTERELCAWAQELGARVRYGHEVLGFTQTPDQVDLTVRGPDGESRVTAAYLVGCDGSRSAVRRAAGIGYPGTPSTVDALMADVSGADLSFKFFERGERGLWAVFPVTPEISRIVVYAFDRPPVRGAAPPDFAEIREAALRVAGIDLGGATAHWVGRHGNTTRLAERLRAGRVLLAGDAAHVVPPAGGQLLTCALHDAVNLGWKLAAQTAGWAPPGLLDSYHDERHPAAARVILNARVQNELMAAGENAEALRTLFTELLALDEVNATLSEQLSGVGVRYGTHEGDHPLLGVRLPHRRLATDTGPTTTTRLLRRARGVLLVLDGGAADPARRWRGRVDTVRAAVLDDAEVLGGVPALLVRPDGHIAWVGGTGSGADGLDGALRRWFGEPSHGGAAR
ncbi:FAD-dependent monooxygenase [Streptomyces sp. NPDC050560]|uniref:FAD-dependent monooxygenase n=1 Tax=Streptomyces sp. NPDC050560 TaxID=3365630 RepID=UPI0037B9A459